MANAANVRVGVTGGVYWAPLGTALPTDATTALNAAFIDLGFISEDGITISTDTDVEDMKAWQNGAVVRSVQTSHDVTIQFTMIEDNPDTQELFYGVAPAGGAVAIAGTQMPLGILVFEVEDDPRVIRVVAPNAKVTEQGDQVFKNDEPAGYETTVKAFPDALGNKYYKYVA